MELNTLKSLLRRFRETVMQEASAKIASVSKDMHEYFSSLGGVLERKFKRVDERFDCIDGKLDAHTEALKRIEDKLENWSN